MLKADRSEMGEVSRPRDCHTTGDARGPTAQRRVGLGPVECELDVPVDRHPSASRRRRRPALVPDGRCVRGDGPWERVRLLDVVGRPDELGRRARNDGDRIRVARVGGGDDRQRLGLDLCKVKVRDCGETQGPEVSSSTPAPARLAPDCLLSGGGRT
jgi:hypothetical protein